MKKDLKKKIIEILYTQKFWIWDIHDNTESKTIVQYHDEFNDGIADKILDLFSQQKQEIVEEIEKEYQANWYMQIENDDVEVFIKNLKERIKKL